MKQRSDTDVHSTCLNHESKWGALRVAIQCIQADRVCGAWLQTLEKQQEKHSEARPKYKNHTSKTSVHL